jgi:4'-phosphopantetheinyl transferase
MWLLGLNDMPAYAQGCREWPHVDVFVVDVDAHEERADMYDSALSSAERKRTRSLRHPEQRKRMTLSRGLFRHIVGAYLGIRAADVPLERDALGKPTVRVSGAVSLQVSCSRSGSSAAFAIGNVEPVGVDVERVALERFSDAVVDEMLTTRERRLYACVPESERPMWLARAWVRKEAILKALGCGLDVAPAAVEVTSTIRTAVPEGLLSDGQGSPYPPRWFFHERHWKENVIALAMRAYACSMRWAEVVPVSECRLRLAQGNAKQTVTVDP